MLNQNQIENESKEINKSVIIKDLSDSSFILSTNNFIDCPSNLYASLFFDSYDQLHSFLNIFYSHSDFHTYDLGLILQRENRNKYCQELDGDTEAIIGSYYNEDSCTQGRREKVILSIRVMKIHGQLLLLSHSKYRLGKQDTNVVHQFFGQPFFINQKGLKKQRKMLEKFPNYDVLLHRGKRRSYLKHLIKSLLDYELVTINNKEYWLNSKQRKNKNLIETLKNESILEKI